ncbi:serine/threonine protein kinase [Nocardia uniformis]|uniref:Serine/threonine protein kinase n=1 Tax=Nocardia uniformis TaxID=53432 RepID=A0A849C2T6_9NOCA|nr:serine/threonine-protein kinase [Nocardia uniformis]NNH71876.1 serine/threonine protein kinase [Nocardia uniformis]
MKALTPADPPWLGRNHMLAVIGRGGMGRVLLGRTPTGRLVAVKQIHRHLADDPEFHARFEREVAASRQVTGAYTAAVVDSGTESETPWLATEYIPGPDLGAVIDDCGPMHLGGLRLLAVGLALALEELHRAGLVHRDLKPGNVLLTPEGPRVIDFGIARSLDGDSTMTATGSVIGSPAYMSPEQAEGRDLTQAADVFSVGAILAMAATGSSPFPGNSTPQILYSVIRATPDIERVPPSVRDLVAACLEKDPAKRPSARQLLEAAGRIPAEPVWPQSVLNRIAEHRADAEWWVETAAKQANQQERLERMRQRRRRTLRAVAVAAVSALVIAGTGVTVYQWARLPGYAEPMTDPSLALTPEELRLIDTCELLDTVVAGQFGARTGDLAQSSIGCGTDITDDTERKLRYVLQVGESSGYSEDSLNPTGETVGWAPILGKDDGSECVRSVINQSGARAMILMRVYALDYSDCANADQAFRAVVERLLVYVPMRKLLPESILRLDPCSLLDSELSLSVAGDPAKRSVEPRRCTVDGSDSSFQIELVERTRPDLTSSFISPATVQIGDYTVYFDERQVDQSSCALEHMVRPTTGKRAEIVTFTIDNYGDAPDACEKAERVLADVLPRLPRS